MGWIQLEASHYVLDMSGSLAQGSSAAPTAVFYYQSSLPVENIPHVE